MRASFVVTFFLAAALAGCLGGEDDPGTDDPGGAPSGEFTEDTGAVVGNVFDANLNPLGNARVSLVAGSEAVEVAQTGDEGGYSLSLIEPGSYRLQVSAACCYEEVRTVQVVAGEQITEDFMLEPMAALELRVPWVDGPHEWTGFVDCMAHQINVCQMNERRHGTTLERGVKTITAGLEWTPNALLGADELTLKVINRDGEPQVIDESTGTSPFEIRLDDTTITDESLRFERFEERSWAIMFEVDGTELEAVWQQSFTIWWTVHYWDGADEEYSTLPDR